MPNYRDELKRINKVKDLDLSTPTKSIYDSWSDGRKENFKFVLEKYLPGVTVEEYFASQQVSVPVKVQGRSNGGIGDTYNKRISSVLLDRLPKTNEVDADWFGGRLVFQNLDRDQSCLLVRISDTEWRECLFSNNDKISGKDLAPLLSKSTAVSDSKWRNLGEELHERLNGVLDECKAFVDENTKERLNSDEIAKFLISRIPAGFLRKYPCFAHCHDMNITDENGKSEKIQVLDWLSFDAGIVDFIQDHTPSLPYEKLRLETFTNDPSVPHLHYLDPEKQIKDGPSPTWDQLFKRYLGGEAKMLKAFIYSIFDASNHSRQIMYIYDPNGFSGKSVMIRAIEKNLGEELVSVFQKNTEDNFVGSKIHGRRLVVRGDNKNPQFLRSEFIHSLTGGDRIEINVKHRQSFTSTENIRILSAGNTALNIDCDAVHEFSRVLVIQPMMTDEILKDFCAVDENGTLIKRNGRPVPKEDGDFEQRLVDEFWYMMKSAKACYEELCQKHADISVPEDVADRRLQFQDDDLCLIDEFVDDHTEIGENFYMKISEMKKLYEDFIDGRKCKRVFDYENFIAHLTKKFNIKKCLMKIDDNRPPCLVYSGIKGKFVELITKESRTVGCQLSFTEDEP